MDDCNNSTWNNNSFLYKTKKRRINSTKKPLTPTTTYLSHNRTETARKHRAAEKQATRGAKKGRLCLKVIQSSPKDKISIAPKKNFW
jgi:hypothetical protein